MYSNGFNKLFWGFFFIMLNFRIQGFDIFPDVVGYLFLASGISNLRFSSERFAQAVPYNYIMIFLSLFSIYQAPAQGGGINLGSFGILGIPLFILSFIMTLLVMYHVFMGIKDIANQLEQYELAQEAEARWGHFKMLQIAFLFSFILIFIPPIAFLYVIVLLIVSFVVMINILGFLRRCSENLIGPSNIE